LLYSYSYLGPPAAAFALTVARPTQATGRVRLHVTGRPPTIKELAFFSAQPGRASGSDAAAKPCNTRLRETVGPLKSTSPGSGTWALWGYCIRHPPARPNGRVRATQETRHEYRRIRAELSDSRTLALYHRDARVQSGQRPQCAGGSHSGGSAGQERGAGG